MDKNILSDKISKLKPTFSKPFQNLNEFEIKSNTLRIK